MSIFAVVRIDVDDPPHLPVGTGAKVTVPKSNRPEEQYATSSVFPTSADSESPRR